MRTQASSALKIFSSKHSVSGIYKYIYIYISIKNENKNKNKFVKDWMIRSNVKQLWVY